MAKSLRIAMLAPLKRPIVPETTVSRNRVIVDLVSELVARGHEVTILGTGDSHLPGVQIHPVIPTALARLPASENPFYQHTAALTRMVAQVVRAREHFDVVHNHMYPEFLPLPVANDLGIPMVTTIHSQMTAEMKQTLMEFPDTTLVALSQAAKGASGVPMEVIYNGIDTEFFVPDPARSRDYLLFVGRMSAARDEKGQFVDPKGVTQAIAVARETGERLKIVGSVEDRAFFDTLVAPHLSATIEFVGEVSGEQTLSREDVRGLYQGAKGLLFPIQWEEPFGLVMAEALACATPVVAYNRGSVSEIVRNGLNGYVVSPSDGIAGMKQAISKIGDISAASCREDVVRRFSKARMADAYEALYTSCIEASRS